MSLAGGFKDLRALIYSYIIFAVVKVISYFRVKEFGLGGLQNWKRCARGFRDIFVGLVLCFGFPVSGGLYVHRMGFAGYG